MENLRAKLEKLRKIVDWQANDNRDPIAATVTLTRAVLLLIETQLPPEQENLPDCPACLMKNRGLGLKHLESCDLYVPF